MKEDLYLYLPDENGSVQYACLVCLGRPEEAMRRIGEMAGVGAWIAEHSCEGAPEMVRLAMNRLPAPFFRLGSVETPLMDGRTEFRPHVFTAKQAWELFGDPDMDMAKPGERNASLCLAGGALEASAAADNGDIVSGSIPLDRLRALAAPLAGEKAEAGPETMEQFYSPGALRRMIVPGAGDEEEGCSPSM